MPSAGCVTVASAETRTCPTTAPTALATSLAPWAKLRSAAANISGMVNITLTRALSLGALVFGAECVLPAAPQRLLPVDADTIMIIRDGRVWLITSP